MALHSVRRGLAVAATLGWAAAMAAAAADTPAGGPVAPLQGPAAARATGAAGATGSAPAPTATPARAAPEAEARLRVAEDEHVRVEELRVRGESRHIRVQPKAPGARPYEIVPPTGAQDPSQRGGRPPAGTSLWRMFSF